MRNSIIVILFIALSSLAFAIDNDIVAGEKVGLDVKHDFGKAILKVSPEKIYGFNDVYEQEINITNTYSEDLYFFLDGYFTDSMIDVKISEKILVKKEVDDYEETCELVGIDHVCNYKINGTRLVDQFEYSVLKQEYKEWGQKNHYHTIEGYLIKKGETKSFQIKYSTQVKKGKWNARIWASETDDWQTILDSRKEAVFDYTIDPTWSGASGITSYYALEDAGNPMVDAYGVMNGTATSTYQVAGKHNYGRNFTGPSLSDGIAINHTTAMVMGQNINTSISFWIYDTNPSDIAHGMVIIKGNEVAPYYKLEIRYNGTTGNLMFYQGLVLRGGISNTSVPANVWTHFVYTYTSGVARVYKNGTLVWSQSGLTDYNVKNETMYFGRRSDGYYNTMILDEVGIWNGGRLLTDSDVTELYNSGAGLFYPFETGDSTNYTVTIENVTYTSSSFETIEHTYTINVSYGANVTNVTNMLFNFNGVSYTPTLMSNGTVGSNNTWKYYYYNLRTPLVLVNNTNLSLNWTFTSVLGNGTNNSESSSNYSQTVYWSFYPQTPAGYNSNAVETSYDYWQANYSNIGANDSGVTLTYWSYWNNTYIANSGVQNYSNSYLVNYSYTLPFINFNNTASIPISMQLNVSFNGTTYTRTTSAGNVTQTVYAMILSNSCSGSTVTRAVNFTFKQVNETIDNTANSSYSILYFVNYNNLSRSTVYTVNNNGTTWLCMYPSFASLKIDFNITANNSNNQTANETELGYSISSTDKQYVIYFGGQYQFIFLDEQTNAIINTTAITVEFIGSNNTYSGSTSNGLLYKILIYPQNYTIRYYASGYGLMRQKLLELTASSLNVTYLYMLSNASSSGLTVNVYDQNTLQPVGNAVVYLQRYNLTSNIYYTVATYTTDINGHAYFDIELENEMYKFVVDYPWQTPVYSSEPLYIETSSLDIYIDTIDIAGVDFFENSGIINSIAYSNGSGTPTFTLTYNDPSNTASQYCLFLKKWGQYTTTLVNGSCSASTSGSISLTGLSDGVNYAVFTAVRGGENFTVNAGWKELAYADTGAKGFGAFLALGIFLTFIFVGFMHTYALILGSVALFLVKIMGLLPLDWGVLIAVFISSLLVVVLLDKR